MRKAWLTLLIAIVARGALAEEAARPPQLTRDVLPVFKTRCVKCHGPGKNEAKLNLSTPLLVARGGENGPVVVPGKLEESLLWHRVEGDEMPPEDPLPDEEKAILKRWIAASAPGLPEKITDDPSGGHWSFLPLVEPPAPEVRGAEQVRTPIDRFVLAELESHGLSLNPEADRPTLIRRVAFALTGLPPSVAEIEAFQHDARPDAYERMVDRYLASPHYGERWGKIWLDAAGYADSNGYFNADTDRPLAYRYRDYVVRSLNQDKPFDRFVVEQLAGDELTGFADGQEATPEVISLLEATHYLRNGQDGSGESDGNPEEVRIDRYTALESCMQIVATSLLGLTMQCAKCHDHKFEPLSQREYYQFQSVFYPAFHVENWIKPNERFVYANLPGELPRWEQQRQALDTEIAALRAEARAWAKEHRPRGTVVFQDTFDNADEPLADRWSNAAPGDDAAGGSPAVALDRDAAPGAAQRGGTLAILENGAAGDRWISTRQAIDWTPDREGDWVQVTFDLVDNKAAVDGPAAERIGYLLALVDFDDNGPTTGGNLLVDGNPSGGAALHLDYPGTDGSPAGTLGAARYEPGHNYGVRITRLRGDQYQLEHLVDDLPDGKPVKLKGTDLPDGGFGFEYCCNRSFVVDNVLIERTPEDEAARAADAKLRKELREKQKQFDKAIKAKEAQRGERPGKIAWLTDRAPTPPEVFLLLRGDPRTHGDKVTPGPFKTLTAPQESAEPFAPQPAAHSSGQRLTWARWLTAQDSRPAALMARVQVNRIWQQHFGAGIVTTSDNLGVSGASPSHPELLEYLAGRFVAGPWSLKQMHRLILTSAVYRQTSALQPAAHKLDPDNRLLWRYSLRRLDAEAVRDAMLAVSGQLDETPGGPYVPTTRNELGEVVVAANTSGALRRSLYLQQRRTQTLSLLGVFDSPTIVFNCVQRPVSTMPLQSLSLLNSEFVHEAAQHFAQRLNDSKTEGVEPRIERAFLLATARAPAAAEVTAAKQFIESQQAQYGPAADAETKAWGDFCHMLLCSSAFLYVE